MLAEALTPILNVSNMDESFAWFAKLGWTKAQGLDVAWPPTDMPWGVREMHVRHPDAHVFRIGKGIEEHAPEAD
jgi:hypothetical protein